MSAWRCNAFDTLCNIDSPIGVERYYLIRSVINYRIVRLHRPYMDRGYLDPDYKNSTSACVEGALAILNSVSYFRSVSKSISWFLTLHCIEAILVLFSECAQLVPSRKVRQAAEPETYHS